MWEAWVAAKVTEGGRRWSRRASSLLEKSRSDYIWDQSLSKLSSVRWCRPVAVMRAGPVGKLMGQKTQSFGTTSLALPKGTLK